MLSLSLISGLSLSSIPLFIKTYGVSGSGGYDDGSNPGTPPGTTSQGEFKVYEEWWF